ncbi:MAG: helix-turn-helix domain-containing protein [Synergistaceae bacterium]|nr:helix-turn-helix domain-containing protein [Synergistaceae bacterium]
MITEKDIYEDYINLATAANMLNVSKSRINILCREGRFEGAFKAGWSWLIPKNTVINFKPQKRGRKRKNHSDKDILTHAITENNKWNKIAV